MLAQLVDSNKTYVSQTINACYHENFVTLLGNSRVKEACRRINNYDQYGQFTLESISEGVGFKSRTTFTTAFKRLIGLTPSEYLKISRKQDKK
jgi:AraC-like DNA-binding protein